MKRAASAAENNNRNASDDDDDESNYEDSAEFSQHPRQEQIERDDDAADKH